MRSGSGAASRGPADRTSVRRNSLRSESVSWRSMARRSPAESDLNSSSNVVRASSGIARLSPRFEPGAQALGKALVLLEGKMRALSQTSQQEECCARDHKGCEREPDP